MKPTDAEFQELLHLAGKYKWAIPGSQTFSEKIWVAYWRDCRRSMENPELGRPVVPHRSG